MKRRNTVMPCLVSLVLVLSLVLAGCGSSPGSAGGTPSAASAGKSLAGSSITVVLPPWGALPSSLLASFKKQTGITVNLQTLDWDQIHDKVATSAAAGVAPADVIEFDWSWVGQFGGAGWFTPLNSYFDKSMLQDTPTTKIFTYNGDLLAMPYANDFRVMVVNKKYFQQAGINTMPTTLDQLVSDAKQLKSKGIVQYPIGEPLSATEGAATPWYLLTKAYGGELFDKNWKPLYSAPDSAGYKAMQFISNNLKAGLIDPAEVGMNDQQTNDAFQAGKYAVQFFSPGALATINDPTKSKVAGQVHAAPVPGASGTAASFGLPEALGIPKSSKHKDAAVRFIQWWYDPANGVMKEMYSAQGDLPPRTSVLSELNKSGKLIDGDVILSQSQRVTPLFPQGTPPWYPKFSTDVATTINEMAKGRMSVAQAMQHLTQAGQSASQ